MNRQDNDKWLDEALTDVIGSQKPRTDFAKWKNNHPDAVEMLTSRAGRQISAAPGPLSIRSIIMKSPITKLATAAVVIIACLIGLSLWRGTESGIALADVLARIEQVSAWKFQMDYSWTYTCKEDPNKSVNYVRRDTELVSQKYGSKTNTEELDPNGGWSKFREAYFLPQKKTKITLLHNKKKYAIEEFEDDWLELRLEENGTYDQRAFLKELMSLNHKSIGRATIDGIEVEGFQTTDPNWSGIPYNDPNISGVDVKLWVDVKTFLPVRSQEDYTQKDSMSNEGRSHWVGRDYRWDILVDAAEFELPVIPDDYTGTVVKWPSNNEENAIKGLKQWVELLGNYPKSFNDMIVWPPLTFLPALEKSETPAAMRLEEELKGLSQGDKTNRLKVAIMPMRCLNRFRVFQLFTSWRSAGAGSSEWRKDQAYYGETVTPTDADKVLWRWRWKVSDNEYRVIYGDLHAETVTPEKLAELEAGLPK